MPFRRLTLANIQLAGRTWEEVAAELQRWLESINNTQDEDSLPPGAYTSNPLPPALSASPGDPTDGWSPGKHVHEARTIVDGGLYRNLTFPDTVSIDFTLTPVTGGIQITAKALPAGFEYPTRTVTGNYTVLSTDEVIYADASSGAITITLPAAASSTDKRVVVKKIDSTRNIVTVDGNASELVEDETSFDLLLQGEAITLLCDGTEWRIL